MNPSLHLRRTSLSGALLAMLAALPVSAQPSGGLHFSTPDQFHGSVSAGTASATPLKLSLQDAIDLGLKNNLGVLVRGSELSSSRADRVRALSALLPNVRADVSETETQISLAVYGLRFPGVPSVVGPFSFTDARASGTIPVFNWNYVKRLKAATQDVRASELSAEDGRDLVVQSVASGYFAILAAAASVEVTRSQIDTSTLLAQTSHDMRVAGVVPALDDIRAQVELKTQQQRLLILQNQMSRDKLVLARAIGLPPGQDFDLTDRAPFSPLENLTDAELLSKAFETRADYRSGAAQLRAAELYRDSARAERLPTGSVNSNYGVIGPSLNSSHGTFTVTATLSINIFDGGRIRADELASDAEIVRRRNEVADLRGKVDFEVRSALLDLRSAAEQVTLARGNVDLANEALTQARDRVNAGVANNLEIVQAQEALAAANQDLVNGEYAHNLAKVALARSVGGTEQALQQFLGSK